MLKRKDVVEGLAMLYENRTDEEIDRLAEAGKTSSVIAEMVGLDWQDNDTKKRIRRAVSKFKKRRNLEQAQTIE